jgi:hypothetical protein
MRKSSFSISALFFCRISYTVVPLCGSKFESGAGPQVTTRKTGAEGNIAGVSSTPPSTRSNELDWRGRSVSR